jgi:hypothetical protein
MILYSEIHHCTKNFVNIVNDVLNIHKYGNSAKEEAAVILELIETYVNKNISYCSVSPENLFSRRWPTLFRYVSSCFILDNDCTPSCSPLNTTMSVSLDEQHQSHMQLLLYSYTVPANKEFYFLRRRLNQRGMFLLRQTRWGNFLRKFPSFFLSIGNFFWL